MKHFIFSYLAPDFSFVKPNNDLNPVFVGVLNV